MRPASSGRPTGSSHRSNAISTAASLGGPIVRNKAFFFADFEGFKQTRGQTASTTIANMAQRNGILTVEVRNPFTGAVYPAGTPIPMTDFARKVLSRAPGADHRPRVEQLSGAAELREHDEQGGWEGQLPSQPATVGVRTLRLARRRHLRRPEHPAAIRRRRQCLHLRAQQAVGAWRHLHAHLDVAARGSLWLVEH